MVRNATIFTHVSILVDPTCVLILKHYFGDSLIPSIIGVSGHFGSTRLFLSTYRKDRRKSQIGK